MRNKFLQILAHYTVIHTWWMAVGILVITLIFGYAVSTLQMRTGFDSLLPGDNPRVAEFNRILEEFQNESNIILLAKGDEDSLKSYARAVKPILEDFDEWVANVHIQIPEEFYRRNALKLIPSDQLDNIGSMYYDPNLVPFLHNMNNSFEGEYQRKDEVLHSREDEIIVVQFLDRLEKFIKIQTAMLNGEQIPNVGQKVVDAITFGETYMLSPDKDMILILIEPTFNMMIEPIELQNSINGIEKIIKDTSVHFGVSAGLTGSLVLGRDEYEAFTSDSWTVSIIALIGIFILFVVSFRMWLSPLLAILTVILGVTWALGFSSILVEYLSMMTAMMSVILIGLGIDFSVHIISGYTEKRNQGLDIHTAMQETLLRFGPGIITGGITTGLAFLTLLISETVGMQEMGLMAGTGIIFTMLATIIILPTLLIIRERFLKNFNKTLSPKDVSYPFLGKIAQFNAKYRWSI